VSAGSAILDAGTPLTAVVAGTDRNAIGILQALTEAGCRVPGEIALVGFDDADEAAQTTPALSTVNVHFDRIGELAAELALRALRGQDVSPRVYVEAHSLILRESCGCGPAGTGSRGPSTGGTRTPRERMARGLRRVLVPETHPLPSVEYALAQGVQAVVEHFEVGGDDGRVTAPLRRVVDALHPLVPRYQVLLQVLEVIARYVEDLAPTPPAAPDAPGVDRVGEPRPAPAPTVATATPAPADRQRLDAALHRLTLSLATAEFTANADFRVGMARQLSTQYDVTSILLGTEEDPASLSWMRWTDVRQACLGRWITGQGTPHDRHDDLVPPSSPGVGSPPRAEDPIEVVGVHGDRLDHLPGLVTTAGQFPPSELVEALDHAPDHVVYLLAVPTGQDLWGVLAVVGTIDVWAIDGREVFNHLASQLGIALRQKAQRDELRAAYDRVRTLVEDLRTSEERYVLAVRAANDGLWDWDLRGKTVFYSEGWDTLLGPAPTSQEQTPDRWLDRVHPEDLPGLHRAVTDCRSGRSGVLEYEHRVRGRDGTYRWMLCQALVVLDDDGEVARLVGSLTDVDDRRRLEERLRHGALYDELTALPNRTFFLERLECSFDQHLHHPTTGFAVLYCDLDGFKEINDTLGHAVGDLLLTAVAARITEAVRADDLAARLGGDEFAVLLSDLGPDQDALVDQVATRIEQSVSSPYLVEGHQVQVGVSIGVASSDGRHPTASALLRHADQEMYRAKTLSAGKPSPAGTRPDR
jgi:diguanylate cyclase (GGDEF)-like protein/PAS domain S-box-containing protein